MPHTYSIEKLQNSFNKYSWIKENLYYQEIYTYYQAYFSLMNEKYEISDFYLLRRRLDMYSPISTINFEYYQTISEVEDFLIKIKKTYNV